MTAKHKDRTHLLETWIVVSEIGGIIHVEHGERPWQAEDEEHAREQHLDAFPDEAIVSVRRAP